jgi:hypothetical protein
MARQSNLWNILALEYLSALAPRRSVAVRAASLHNPQGCKQRHAARDSSQTRVHSFPLFDDQCWETTAFELCTPSEKSLTRSIPVIAVVTLSANPSLSSLVLEADLLSKEKSFLQGEKRDFLRQIFLRQGS